MNQILQYLKNNGERLDAEIAQAAGISLSKTRAYLAELAAKGEIMAYHSTRFEDGEKTEGIRCRLAGFTPPAKPGRKSKAS
ncbi:MAG: winged helix-turn-helix domain-containing protein [Gallionella sp.]|jgi:DNA-binding IclR family transcriptional regulator|nr:winged helix-turn-helix domain-containing protein [Gallionella sp.]